MVAEVRRIAKRKRRGNQNNMKTYQTEIKKNGRWTSYKNYTWENMNTVYIPLCYEYKKENKMSKRDIILFRIKEQNSSKWEIKACGL